MAVDIVVNDIVANFFPHIIGERTQPAQLVAREQNFSVFAIQSFALKNFSFNFLKLSSDKQNFSPPLS